MRDTRSQTGATVSYTTRAKNPHCSITMPVENENENENENEKVTSTSRYSCHPQLMNICGILIVILLLEAIAFFKTGGTVDGNTTSFVLPDDFVAKAIENILNKSLTMTHDVTTMGTSNVVE